MNVDVFGNTYDVGDFVLVTSYGTEIFVVERVKRNTVTVSGYRKVFDDDLPDYSAVTVDSDTYILLTMPADKSEIVRIPMDMLAGYTNRPILDHLAKISNQILEKQRKKAK